jgi:SMC interacting uncharacterized protein involved in chromosome segregation
MAFGYTIDDGVGTYYEHKVDTGIDQSVLYNKEKENKYLQAKVDSLNELNKQITYLKKKLEYSQNGKYKARSEVRSLESKVDELNKEVTKRKIIAEGFKRDNLEQSLYEALIVLDRYHGSDENMNKIKSILYKSFIDM